MLSLMSTCSSSAVEHAAMERAVRDFLIPHLYRAMALKPSDTAAKQLDAFKQGDGPVMRAGKRGQKAARFAQKSAQARAASATAGGAAQKREPDERGIVPDPSETNVVYNICNDALDDDDFGAALAACPQVVKLFEQQVRYALVLIRAHLAQHGRWGDRYDSRGRPPHLPNPPPQMTSVLHQQNQQKKEVKGGPDGDTAGGEKALLNKSSSTEGAAPTPPQQPRSDAEEAVPEAEHE
jgi:hypothetical protein